MRRVIWSPKSSLLFFGVLFIVISIFGSIALVGRIIAEKKELGKIEIAEFESKFESPLIDISYEDMRVYMFPDNEMLIIKSPKYLKYHDNGGHIVIVIDIKKDTVKAITINNNWDYFTIYLKGSNLPFEKEKLKKEEKGF